MVCYVALLSNSYIKQTYRLKSFTHKFLDIQMQLMNSVNIPTKYSKTIKKSK